MATSSRAIAVIGMHRSGTSAVARGLAALGVYLGDNFLDAQPENPTGYWEDKGIYELDERLLRTLRLQWDGIAPIEERRLRGWRTWRLRREAIAYLRRNFTRHPLWGFKDPRVVRLLPFWRRVLRDAGVDDSYLLTVRNPASVAASLFARQRTDVETAQRLWLLHLVPFLHEVAGRPLAVVDYDALIANPRGQLERIARRLAIPVSPGAQAEVNRYASEFLDASLRHTVFGLDDVDATTEAGRLARDAYGLLLDLAGDRRERDAAFWNAWERIRTACRTSLAWPSTA